VAKPVARAVVARRLRLRLTHPAAPARDARDLIMRGRDAQLDLGADAIQPLSSHSWLPKRSTPNADPVLLATLLQIWRDEVWLRFLEHYISRS